MALMSYTGVSYTYLILLYLINSLLSDTLNLYSSVLVQTRLHTHTNNKIVVLYITIFSFQIGQHMLKDYELDGSEHF